MPFFQGAYNFELHGGSFHGSRTRRRRRQSNTNQSFASHKIQSTQHDAHRFTNLSTAVEPANSESSEKTIDEEAQTLPGSLSCWESTWASLTDTIPSQIYTQLLLRLPPHYVNRVDRLSRDANMALKEILDMAVQTNAKCGNDFQTEVLDLGQHSSSTIVDPESLPPAYRQLTIRWSCFIDDLLEEWRTLNLVSALLVPGILTMFQVTGASNDPVTRYLAFWSLISALISLLYGCAFIIQFSRMRKPSIAIEWAFEAQNPHSTLWSVGVMLSMPVVWLAWSIVGFIVCIIGFMWRCDANPPAQFFVPPHTELIFRIFVSAVLGVGAFYGILIFTSFQRYGPKMDEALSRRIDAYIASAASSSSISTQLPMSDSLFLGQSLGQSSKRRKSRSWSPSPSTAAPSPLAHRSASLGQSSSTASHQPSPLSNSTIIEQTEQPILSSRTQPSDNHTSRIADSYRRGRIANITVQSPSPITNSVIRSLRTESLGAGRATGVHPGIIEENHQFQEPHDDYDDRTRYNALQDSD